MIVVSNSSPLIALDRIGKVDLVNHVFGDVLIPPAVLREIGIRIAALKWLLQRPVTRAVDNSVLRMTLGAGETEAIQLALEVTPNWLILDDRPARRVAQGRGIPVVGTLGLLLVAKRKGVLAELRPELQALQNSGFHVSQHLFDQVLSDAGELDR